MIRQDVRVPIQAAGGDEMSNANQETIADIVREMRIGDLCANDTTTSMVYINDFLASYADRIEAAHQREVAELRECLKETMADAVAEYKNNSCFKNVKCGEIERCKTCKVVRWRKAIETTK